MYLHINAIYISVLTSKTRALCVHFSTKLILFRVVCAFYFDYWSTHLISSLLNFTL